MKRLNAVLTLIGTIAALAWCAAPATAVTVTGTVVLDGVLDPFGNLTGTAAGGDATYNFTDGLNFDPGGKIEIWDHTLHFAEADPGPPPAVDLVGHEGHKRATMHPITFTFAPGTGGMDMGTNGYIDIMTGRRGGGNDLTFNMNDNDITGTGSINNCLTDASCAGGGGAPGSTGPPFGNTAGAMDVVINSSADVSLKEIIAGGADAGGGAVNITAAGHVAIGTISTRDPSGGGSSADPLTVKAGSMRLGDLRSDALRAGSSTSNGNISLTALAPPSYDPGNAAGNTPANLIELYGLIDTHGARDDHSNGNLSITAVKVVLESTFAADLDPEGVQAITVGAPDLFVNMSSGEFSATADVDFTRPIIPEPSTLILLVFCSLFCAAIRRRAH